MWCGRISGCGVDGSVGVVWTDQWVWCGRISGCGVDGSVSVFDSPSLTLNFLVSAVTVLHSAVTVLHSAVTVLHSKTNSCTD